MDLSIIIVNFNAAQVLVPCLQSIERFLAAVRHEVCVVDNASSDQSVALVRQSCPHVTLVAHRRNRGFAAGINSGLRNTSGKYVMWLNPDSEILNEGASELIQYLSDQPQIGIVGPQILNGDQSVQLSCRSFPSYSTALFNRYSWLTRLRPRNRFTQRYLQNGWDHASARRVDWVSGACLVHRRAVAERLGGLDESYFLYAEDVDFCRRAHQAGWQVHYHPAMRVLHHIGGSSRHVPRRSIVERHRSMWRYYCKHYRRNPVKDAAVGTGIAARCLWFVLGQSLL
jgi:GT2 family glycosyltransferase